MKKTTVICLILALLLTGCAARAAAPAADGGWKGRGTNAIPSVLAEEDALYIFENQGSSAYLMREQKGQDERLCKAEGCEHGPWDCPAAAWNDTISLTQYGDALYARSIGAGAVVRYALSGTSREELVPREEKVEAFAIGEGVLYAVLQPADGGFAVLALSLDEQGAPPRRIAFADAGALVGTDSALYRDGKLLVAQTMSADGKAFMRIAQLDLQSANIDVLAAPVADRVVSVTGDVLAYCETWDDGYAVCLRSLKDGDIAQCAQSSAPVDIIATQSGFALDDGRSPRTVTWVDAAGKTLGSAALDGQVKPCSGALHDDLYYVNAADMRTVVVLSPNKSA